MSSEFFRTRMGQQFFEGTMPRLIDALRQIGEALHPAEAAQIDEDNFWDKAFLASLTSMSPNSKFQIMDAAALANEALDARRHHRALKSG